MNNWVKIAYVENTHGVRGEIRVRSLSTVENRLETVKKIYMGEEKTPYSIDKARKHKGNTLWQLEGLDNLNDVEKFKGQYVYVPEEDVAELPENAWYYFDLIGLKAIDRESKETVGVVEAIEETFANEVLVIKKEDGSIFMIPFVDAFVGEVNLQEKTIEVLEIEEL